MTRSPLWREFESGDNLLLRALRILILFGGLIFLIFAGVLELTWPQQAVLGLLIVLLAIWMDRSSTSYLVTLTLMLMSCYSTFRYGYWRVATVIRFFADPGTSWTALDAFFIWLLVGRGVLRLCDSLSRLHADALAAASRACAAAGRSLISGPKSTCSFRLTTSR